MAYPFGKIEKKWAKKWQESGVYEPSLSVKPSASRRKPFYNLMMFPYPSAEGLHVGNMYAFTGSDIYGRFRRMQGNDVFEPIGLDGFGIHSENYALKIGTHPAKQAQISEKNFYRQLSSIGNGFAWNERLETYDPEYYKWTQWIFIQLFKKGLAYRKKQSVNWCPSCKTVLADEQVIGGKCERCSTKVIKKELEQWFFRITRYADRLLGGLDGLDWSERVKTAQRNWIGRSEGALISFKIQGTSNKIEVFTTRPDTIYGATYMVLAPEHPLIENLKIKIKNWREVEKYIKRASAKSEEERIAEGNPPAGGKTGIELKGVKAINPATKKEIPVWVADYVLGNVGTGAIMAVPAHDARDFEFAARFNLPIEHVIRPIFFGDRKPKASDKLVERRTIHALVVRPKDGKILVLDWKKWGWKTLIIGGCEDRESPKAAALREVREETGLKTSYKGLIGSEIESVFFADHKDEWRHRISQPVLLELAASGHAKPSKEEEEKHTAIWLDPREALPLLSYVEDRMVVDNYLKGNGVYTGEGNLFNSGKFDGLNSEKAKWEITKFVGGKRKTQYRLRDWLISRQRYWGPPIPMIYCERCGWQPVPEKNLPVKLPLVKNFRPTGKGESPLASVKSFYETKCPQCGGKAKRETDVSDTFLDSAWYFFRYIDHKNKQKLFDKQKAKKWLPVDAYIGGAEHSVLHLLYSRFITMVFKDMKIIDFDEPYSKFRAHGLLISEGAKMSKSKGNVVIPDAYVKKFGADVVRTYLMFIGPFEQGGDWRDAGIMGLVRFLDRVWALGNKISEAGSRKPATISNWLHISIKEITKDINELKYNTAISRLMTILNKLEKETQANRKDWEAFLLMLAPFAPFITEELWGKLGNKYSIHRQSWPKHDSKYLIQDMITLIVQVNGKLRSQIEIKSGTTQKEAEKLALADFRIQKFTRDKKVKRTIFIKNRLINFVV